MTTLPRLDPIPWDALQMIDDLLSPYSEPAFERVARKRGYSRGGCTAFMVLAGVMAVVLFFGACAMLTVLARHYYLETYGIAATATAINATDHTSVDRTGRTIDWKRIQYEFSTHEGKKIRNVVDRPDLELAGLPRFDQFTVVYWQAFPSVSAPRGLRTEILPISFVALICLLATVHFGGWSRRFMFFRRRLTNPPDATQQAGVVRVSQPREST